MSIQMIALILLIARLISVVFIINVMYRQYKLFGTHIDFELVPNLTKLQRRNVYIIRRILFTLSLVILAGNIVPVVIDAITIFTDNTGRPANLRPISIAYAFSNSLTAMFSAIMIWTLYKVAGLGSSHKD